MKTRKLLTRTTKKLPVTFVHFACATLSKQSNRRTLMNYITVLFGIAGAVVLLYTLRKRLFLFGFLNALCGFFSLIAVYLVFRLLQIDFPVTVFGILTGAIGGIPGVILLTVLLTVFRLP